MSKCLIIINHSFRTNSLIFQKALFYNNVCVVYISNYYLNKDFQNFYKTSNNDYYYKVLDDFAVQLKEKYNLSLKIIKSLNAVNLIEDFCKSEEVEKVFYDKPLFSEKLQFNDILVEEVDSDSFIDECTKMSAKSRWVYWTKNKTINNNNIFCAYRKLNDFGNIGEAYIPNIENASEIRKEVCESYKRFKQKLKTYHETRNEREGSTKLSKFLHHGLIDARVITYLTLSVSPDYIDKNFPTVPLLRQLAFREISIRKCREKNIGLLDDIKVTAKKLLDEKSYDNLINNEFESVFTKEQFMNGNTGINLLDREIKLCIKNRWMPNRLRMWLSGECYWGFGGGLKSLETLIEFFNLYSEDGQSPNNIINCVGCMRLQYGKVMRYNQERTFMLVSGKEVIK